MNTGTRFVLAIFLAFVFLGALSLAGCTLPGTPPNTNSTQNITKPFGADANSDGYKLISNSFDRLAELKDYSIAINETKETYNIIQTAQRINGLEQITISSPVDTKDIYWTNNGTIYCIKTEDSGRECFTIANESDFNSEVLGYKTLFYDERYTKGSKQENDIFQSSYARIFTANVTDRTYNGLPCKQTEFTTDYKKMTVSELENLGLTAETYQYNDNFKTQLCINDRGLPIFLNVSYREVYGNMSRSTVRTITNFKETGLNIDVPEVNSNETVFTKAYNGANSALRAYAKCFRIKDLDEKNDCYKGTAFEGKDEKLCEKIADPKKHDQCVLAIMTSMIKPELCQKTTIFADDCYAEAARITKNMTFCESVKNQTVKELCVDMVTGKSAAAGKCASDSDCAPTGCSGNICGLAAKPVSTTCEWKEEYSCYTQDFASCDCNAGTCAWKASANLTACIEQKTNATGNTGTGN